MACSYRVETTPDGARVTIGIVAHEGRFFEAVGGVVDEARGIVFGYPKRMPDGSWCLEGWDGPMGIALELVSMKQHRGAFRGHFRTEPMHWRATLGGHRYHGRNQGEGMALTLRRGKGVE